MVAYLKGLAIVLLIAGVLICFASARAAIDDEIYYKTALALERHPDHILYQAEYHAALARHIAYILTAIVSGMGGVLGSAMLLGIAAILQRLDRPRAEPAR